MRTLIVAKRLGIGLGGAYAAYVLIVALILNSGWITRKINTSWNDGHIAYSWAWSPFPAFLHIHNFELRHEDHNVRWNLKLGRVVTWLRPLDLFFSRITVPNVGGAGGEFRFVEKRLQKQAKWRDALPEIPNVPDRKEVPPNPKEKLPLPESPTQVSIQGVRLRDFKVFWFDQYRYEGPIEVSGGFKLSPQVLVEVDPAGLRAQGGALKVGSKTIAERIELDLAGRISPFPAKAVPDMRIFHFVSAEAKLAAEGNLAALLNFYLQGKWPMRTAPGEGALVSQLVVKRGIFQEGSEVNFRSKNLAFELGAAQISGTTRFDWKVASGLGQFDLHFENFAMASWQASHKKPMLQGDFLKLDGSGMGVSLEKNFSKGGQRNLTVKDAKLRLEAIQDFLPRKTPLSLQRGEAVVNASVRGEADGLDRGTVSLRAPKLQIAINKKRVRGGLTLSTEFLSPSFTTGEFTLKQCQIDMKQVRVDSASVSPTSPWWGQIRIPSGEVKLGGGANVRIPVRFTLLNAAPVVEIFDLGGELPPFVRDALNEQKLTGEGTVQADKEVFAVKNARVQNQNLDLRGRYRSASWDTRGVFYAEWAPFAVGIELVGKETRVVLHEAATWFQKYPPLTEPATGAP